MTRQVAEASGRRAESFAATWLRLKGWRILAKRVRTPAGEIDIVARRPGIVAFVEVKSRGSVAELDFAIDDYRLRRVAAAAEILVPRYVQPGDDIRIDVILIAPRALPRHLVNVWHG
jgi:putative endonuclease